MRHIVEQSLEIPHVLVPIRVYPAHKCPTRMLALRFPRFISAVALPHPPTHTRTYTEACVHCQQITHDCSRLCSLASFRRLLTIQHAFSPSPREIDVPATNFARYKGVPYLDQT